jgi:small subunit ribosomal protein S14
MAKESLKAREVKREKLIAKYAAKRKELKKIINGADYEAKEAAIIALQKLPPNSNPIRLHNRCKLTGRPKGYIRQFGISRINFREMANQGLIPGVRKASW